MKSTLINLSLICLVSTLTLGACVKKENPEHADDSEQQAMVEQQSSNYTSLEEVPSDDQDANAVMGDDEQTRLYNEGQSDVTQSTTTSTANTTTTIETTRSTTPSRTVEPVRNNNSAAAASANDAANTVQAAANQTQGAAASEDDAIAAALKAAQPALQQ